MILFLFSKWKTYKIRILCHNNFLSDIWLDIHRCLRNLQFCQCLSYSSRVDLRSSRTFSLEFDCLSVLFFGYGHLWSRFCLKKYWTHFRFCSSSRFKLPMGNFFKTFRIFLLAYFRQLFLARFKFSFMWLLRLQKVQTSPEKSRNWRRFFKCEKRNFSNDILNKRLRDF